MKSTLLGWHFLHTKTRLRDGSAAAPAGGIETYTGHPVLCIRGLHAGTTVFNALNYARGTYCRRVELSGRLFVRGDKGVAVERRIIAEADVRYELIAWARWCVQVIDQELLPKMKKHDGRGAEGTREKAFMLAHFCPRRADSAFILAVLGAYDSLVDVAALINEREKQQYRARRRLRDIVHKALGVKPGNGG